VTVEPKGQQNANDYAVATPGGADGKKYKIITKEQAKQY